MSLIYNLVGMNDKATGNFFNNTVDQDLKASNYFSLMI
jgi:hypothetical protein